MEIYVCCPSFKLEAFSVPERDRERRNVMFFSSVLNLIK